jgi:hypothetical protein
MRRLIAVALLLLAARTADAQQAPLAPLEFLVGHCWIGTFPDGKATDEHCFEWMYDRKFIRDRHVVRGGDPYSGETIYMWDAAAKRITFQYYSSAGFVIPGTAIPSAEGIEFPHRQKTAAGEVDAKAVWTRLGTDGYRVWQGQKNADGTWKTLWTMDLKLTPSAAHTGGSPD